MAIGHWLKNFTQWYFDPGAESGGGGGGETQQLTLIIKDGVVTDYSTGFHLVAVIPDGVTSIGDYAFRDCVGLTSITIPDSVTNIGLYAFSGCEGLTEINCGFAEDAVGGAPWGAPSSTRINYNV